MNFKKQAQYLKILIKTVKNRLKNKISTEEVFSNAGIMYENFNYIEEDLWVRAFTIASCFIVEQLNNGLIPIKDVTT